MSIAMRLKVMSFLQYFIWGSWLVTLGSYMINTLHFTGANVGMVYSSKGIAAQTNGCAQNVHTCCVTWCVRAYFFMRHP